MRRAALAFAAIGAIWSTPAFAGVHHLKWTGSVSTVQSNAAASDIRVGDLIFASLTLDDALATGPTVLPLGGGFYSIYAVPISAFTLSVGSYAVSYSALASALTYIDNSFGGDGIVISMDRLPGGPFGGTFADVQFQARGPSTAIDDTGIGNGLPYERFTPSFFVAFGGGGSGARVFGDLAVSDSTVPEPATWLELLIGFGMMGPLLRRRAPAAPLGLPAAPLW